MALSRQFRDKDNEYFEFNITTTAESALVRLGIGIDGQIMDVVAGHRIDWGDGTRPEQIFADRLNHTYSDVGTYPVKIWTREKNTSINSWVGGSFGGTNQIDILDFSDFKRLNFFGIQGVIGDFTFPTSYDGTTGLQISCVGSNTTYSSTTFDATIWNDTIIRMFSVGTDNLERIKIPVTNSHNDAQFYWASALSALGPNADDLSAFDIDFSNYNLDGQFRVNCSPNITSFNLPASAFSTNGLSNTFYLQNYPLTTLDLSNLKMSSSTASFILNSTVLTSITWPTSVVSTLQTITFQANPAFTGAIDLSGFAGIEGNFCTLNARDTLATSVIFPTGNGTFSQISVYPNTLPSSSGQCTEINLTAVPLATEKDGFTLQMQNNGMTAAQVNKILVDLDTNATSGFTGRSIQLSGTNSAPDGTSGGLDGVTAKDNLITKNFTVTTS